MELEFQHEVPSIQAANQDWVLKVKKELKVRKESVCSLMLTT